MTDSERIEALEREVVYLRMAIQICALFTISMTKGALAGDPDTIQKEYDDAKKYSVDLLKIYSEERGIGDDF